MDALHTADKTIPNFCQFGFTFAVAGGDFAFDINHFIHGFDRFVGDLGQYVNIAPVTAEAARCGSGGFMRTLGGQERDLPVCFVQLLGFISGVANIYLDNRLGGDRHQSGDDHQQTIGDFHHAGLQRPACSAR